MRKKCNRTPYYQSVRAETVSESFRKRLYGGDCEDTNSYEVAPEKGKLVKKPKLMNEVIKYRAGINSQ